MTVDGDFARAVLDAAAGRAPEEPDGLFADPDLLEHHGIRLLTVALDSAEVVVPRAAVALLSRLVDLTDDPATRASFLSNLSLAHVESYRCGGDPADLDEAVPAGERSVEVVDHPGRPVLLSNLGIALRALHSRSQSPEHLDRAVQVVGEAFAALPDGHPDRALYLSNLASALTARSWHADRPSDADLAVRCGARAVEWGARDSGLPLYLHRLADAHFERHRSGGPGEDLDAAVARGEEAAATAPPSQLAGFASSLGTSYLSRHRRDRDPVDLDRAVECGLLAVRGTGSAQPALASRAANLGVAQQERYERTGRSADLDGAVESGERSIGATTPGDSSLPQRLSLLGAAYQLRYDRDGEKIDLDHAVDVGEWAAASGSAEALSNVALARWRRYERDEDEADLDRAVQAGELAVVAGRAAPDLVAMRVNLGLALLRRFEDRGADADLDRAVRIARAAVAETPVRHGDHPTHLSNLGNVLLKRCWHLRSTEGLAEAVERSRLAVELTPDDHPRAAVRLANLANVLLKQHELTGRPVEAGDLEQVVARCDRIGDSCPPTDLVRLGHRAGTLAYAAGSDHAAVRLLDDAVELLSSAVTGEARRRVDQEYWLGENRRLIGDAVAAHHAVGDPEGAVEVAESGRGVLLGAAFDARADLAGLDAEAAARLRVVRDRLNRAEDRAERARLWAEHQDLLAGVREAGFLRRPRFAELRRAVAGGAAVLVNVGPRGGHAIVVTADGPPVPVDLPVLTRADVDRHAEALLGATYDGGELRGARGPVVTGVLEWLWTAVVGPVLEAVPLERVWWLPIGVLGLFPLHAAQAPGEPGALDLVVSSCTPTLRTLARARERRAETERRVLGVAVGAGLPGAKEMDVLADHVLAGADAVPDRVLAALPLCTWAYFACHADIDLRVPSLGALHLHGADLPVSAVNALDLAHAELAYLSACSGGHRGVRHVDESIHPASAFQLAGFRHVVAGMWPLNHSVAKRAAKRFHGLVGDRSDTAAGALRDVVRELRARYPESPAVWASLVHSGP